MAWLRVLAVSWEFADLNDALADQIIKKCTSICLKRCVFRDNNIDHDKILETGRAMERAENQVQNIKPK